MTSGKPLALFVTKASLVLFRRFWPYAIVAGILFTISVVTFEAAGSYNNPSSSYASPSFEASFAPADVQEKPFKVPGPETLCPDQLDEEETAKRIVYIESSGNECLTARQACGIESASRTNPHMHIDVYLNTKQIGDQDAEKNINRRSCAFNNIVFNRSNVSPIREDFSEKLRNTPFRKLFESGKLRNSPWSSVQLSDAMRNVYLYERGGIYLDFDVMVFRPLHCLRNTLSYMTVGVEPDIQNCVLVKQNNALN